jgi:hypothetical protein
MYSNELEVFHLADAEMGDAAPQQLAWFMERKYGVKIDPRLISSLQASQRRRRHSHRRRDFGKTEFLRKAS